jgi:3D (Asp-Asp-Asp) domain-containing protein
VLAAAVWLCALLAGCGGGAHAPAPEAAKVAAVPTAAVVAHPAPVSAHAAGCNRKLPPERLLAHRQWLSDVIITEYYPVPERWSGGIAVRTPGIAERHRVDWLYSAKGVSMEGDGVDLAGRHVHIAELGSAGWVNASGRRTVPPRCGIHWSQGAPFWRAGGWRNRAGEVTYPLVSGGWSNGSGHYAGGYGGATFALGSSLPLRYYRSVAVDPRLIPRGSRIYIGAYRAINGGWFVAQDTGGAIIGHHIDVYRPPTTEPFGSGRLLLHQRVYVIPPGA